MVEFKLLQMKWLYSHYCHWSLLCEKWGAPHEGAVDNEIRDDVIFSTPYSNHMLVQCLNFWLSVWSCTWRQLHLSYYSEHSLEYERSTHFCLWSNII